VIVNVSSGIVNMPGSLFAVYASSKAFVDKFTEALRYEYRKTKIYFQNVNPGLVETQLYIQNVGKQPISFGIDGIKYSRGAVSTIG
jgi:short-subunit dehydrogenase